MRPRCGDRFARAPRLSDASEEAAAAMPACSPVLIIAVAGSDASLARSEKDKSRPPATHWRSGGTALLLDDPGSVPDVRFVGSSRHVQTQPLACNGVVARAFATAKPA